MTQTAPDAHFDTRMGAVIIKETPDWIVAVSPMIYNDRILFALRRDYPGYTAGWCYNKGGSAVLAALAWDPDTEHTPVGLKKEAARRPSWDV